MLRANTFNLFCFIFIKIKNIKSKLFLFFVRASIYYSKIELVLWIVEKNLLLTLKAGYFKILTRTLFRMHPNV